MSIRILHVEIGRPPRENKSVERAAGPSILENLALTSIQSRLKLMKGLCTVSHIMVMLLRSKWAAGKARGGRISESIRNRRATQPPAHFQRNPPGRGRLAGFSALRGMDPDMGALPPVRLGPP